MSDYVFILVGTYFYIAYYNVGKSCFQARISIRCLKAREQGLFKQAAIKFKCRWISYFFHELITLFVGLAMKFNLNLTSDCSHSS